MTDTMKIIVAGIVGGLVVLLLSVFLTAINGGNTNLSGVYEITEQQFGGGIDITESGKIKVDGTTVIDTSGNIVGSIINPSETVTGDDTITANQCGSTFFLSTTGSTSTLPAVTAGCELRFQVGAAFDTNDWIVDSAEGDNIYGTLSVNNADVVCSAEDEINFIADGEVVGDYVEIISDGTNWLITGSDVDTAAKVTCTDPN